MVNFVATVLVVVVGFRLPVHSGTSSLRLRRRHSCGLRWVFSMASFACIVVHRGTACSAVGVARPPPERALCMICTLHCVFSPCRRQCTSFVCGGWLLETTRSFHFLVDEYAAHCYFHPGPVAELPRVRCDFFSTFSCVFWLGFACADKSQENKLQAVVGLHFSVFGQEYEEHMNMSDC